MIFSVAYRLKVNAEEFKHEGNESRSVDLDLCDSCKNPKVRKAITDVLITAHARQYRSKEVTEKDVSVNLTAVRCGQDSWTPPAKKEEKKAGNTEAATRSNTTAGK